MVPDRFERDDTGQNYMLGRTNSGEGIIEGRRHINTAPRDVHTGGYAILRVTVEVREMLERPDLTAEEQQEIINRELFTRSDPNDGAPYPKGVKKVVDPQGVTVCREEPHSARRLRVEPHPDHFLKEYEAVD